MPKGHNAQIFTAIPHSQRSTRMGSKTITEPEIWRFQVRRSCSRIRTRQQGFCLPDGVFKAFQEASPLNTLAPMTDSREKRNPIKQRVKQSAVTRYSSYNNLQPCIVNHNPIDCTVNDLSTPQEASPPYNLASQRIRV